MKAPEGKGNYQEFGYKKRLIWTEIQTRFFRLYGHMPRLSHRPGLCLKYTTGYDQEAETDLLRLYSHMPRLSHCPAFVLYVHYRLWPGVKSGSPQPVPDTTSV